MPRIASHTATFTPISTYDVRAGLAERRPPYGATACRVLRAPSLTHDGHWKPTAASRMHSGQIGRLQRWQRMWVSRPVCR